MAISIVRDPDSSDLWLLASADGKPQLGAYMPGSGEINLTVYWNGQTAALLLANIIAEAESTLRELTDVRGTLIAYGKKRVHVGPAYSASSLLKDKFLTGFDAYRAELESGIGKVIIWANVSANEAPRSQDGEENGDKGENIGICVTPPLFDGPMRPVYEHAILKTRDMKSQTVVELLNEISNGITP
jgi:hypothetical protein